MWWSWIEICDRCGAKIRNHNVCSSIEPDTDEADFCVICLRHLMGNNIPYETAKQEYKRRGFILVVIYFCLFASLALNRFQLLRPHGL